MNARSGPFAGDAPATRPASFGARTSPVRLPAVLWIAVALSTALVWRNLLPLEHDRVALEVGKITTMATSSLGGKLRGQVAALLRQAERLDQAGAARGEVFDADAARYLRDYPALLALRHVAAGAGALETARPSVEPAALFASMPAPRPADPVPALPGYTRWLSPPVSFDGRPVYFLLFFRAADAASPVFVAALDARRWLGEAFDDLPHYAVELTDGAVSVYLHPVDDPQREFAAQTPIEAVGRSWRVIVTPSAHAVAAMTTRLPALVLAGGLLLASLLAAGTYFVLLARERAELVARTRADLDVHVQRRLRAESELGSILESITDGFIIVDRDWRYVYANEAGGQPIGRTPAELLGRSLWEMAPAFAASDESGHLRRAMRDRVSVTFERRAVDGRVYGVRAYPHLDGLAIYFHDVSAGREIADRLRKSEALLRQAQSVAHVGSFVQDVGSGAEQWSEELFRLLGLEPGSVAAGRERLLAHVREDERERVAAAFAALGTGSGENELDLHVTRADGERRTMRLRLRQEQDALGTALAVAGTLQDVTEQERASAALNSALARSQRQSAQLRALNRAMLLVSAKLGHADLQQVLVEELREAVHANLAALHLLPGDGAAPPPCVSFSDKYAARRGAPVPMASLEQLVAAARGGRVLRLDAEQVAAHPAWAGLDAGATPHGLLSAPLHDRDGRLLGYLQASDRRDGEFGADDEAVATQFAQIASIAIGWARLIGDLRRTHASLSEQLDRLDRSNALLAEAERVARLGSWELALGAARPRVLQLSDEAVRVLGIPGRDAGLRSLAARIHPDDAARVRRQYAALIAGGVEALDSEFRVGHAGRYRWVHGQARRVAGPPGHPPRLVGSVQDVTERHDLAEQEHLRAEALARIAAGAPLADSLADVAGLYESRFRDGACSILLADAGRRLYTAAAPHLPAEYSAGVDGIVAGPSAGSCGTAAWSGERVVVGDIASDPLWNDYAALALRHGLKACWSTPIRAADGSVAGTFAVYYREPRTPSPEEIESVDRAASIAAIAIEAHASRRRIEDREQRFRSLFAYVPEAVFALDLDGVVVDCNEAAPKMSGCVRERLLGRPLRTVVAAEDRERFDAHLALAVAGAPQQIELHHLRADGSQYLTSSTSTPIIVDGGHVGVFAIVRDITRERSDQAALEQALRALQAHNRELEEFAFVASHDLQEPLRKVRAFGDRLRLHLGERADAESGEYIERMCAAAGRMQRLIDDLLAYSRVAKRAQEKRTVDLGAVLRGVLADLETRIEQKRACIGADALPVLQADETQMRQLLQNLLSNALKFAAEGRTPQIRVEAEVFHDPERIERRPWVRLVVRDNGIGFDNRYAERIFAPFQRLHGRGEYEGSGIGLAIVRRIVERHGGRIFAEGRPGDGAVFTIELPQFESAAARERSAPA